MPKRRRDAQVNAEEKTIRTNPFLDSHNQDLNDSQENDGLFEDILEFQELSKVAHKDQDVKLQTKFKECLRTLLSFLETKQNHPVVNIAKDIASQSANTYHSLISFQDVATLLLQWAIKGLLRGNINGTREAISADELIKWKTLEVSCQTLLSSQDNSSIDVGAILTQSLLNKLVPLAIQMASSSEVNHQVNAKAGSCYCLLMERMYRPTFDLICDTLLPHDSIGRNGETELTRGDKQVNGMVPSVTLSTLRLLRTMQGKANPKKAFQILSRPSVLLKLSEIYHAGKLCGGNARESSDLAKIILFDGLFSYTHHLDGFRSLQIEVPSFDFRGQKQDESRKTADVDGNNLTTEGHNSHAIKVQPKFRCYQADLFQTTDELLSVDNDTSGIKAKTRGAKVIPLLIKGFISHARMSLDMKNRDKKRNQKRLSNYVAEQLQFRFFARLVGSLLKLLQSLRSDSAEVRLAVTVAMRQCLELVLENDVYVPSDQDKGNQHFTFLNTISCRIREQHANCVLRFQAEAIEGLRILDLLARLNHRFLHDHLGDVIAFCLTWQPEHTSKIVPEAVALLTTIIRVYKKLRRLHDLFRYFLDGVDTLRKTAQVRKLRALEQIIANRQISVELALAVQATPTTEIHQIFADSNAWLCRTCKTLVAEKKTLTPDGQGAISLAVALFSDFIRNIRVDKATAAAIDSLCSTTMNDSVDLLTGGASENSSWQSPSFLKDGMRLCGWTIFLQTRCLYWVGSENTRFQTEMPRRVTTILATCKEDHPTSDERMASFSNELQFLACHRIQQLHSIIHEQERCDLALECAQRSTEYIAEARRLTAFSVKVACFPPSKREGLCGWRRLADTVVAWAPYSTPEHFESFLDWLFSVISTINSAHSPPGQVAPGQVEVQTNETDCGAALALLRDANFWELKQVACSIGLASLRRATEFSKQAVSCVTGSTRVNYAGRDLMKPIESSEWEHARSDFLLKIINGKLQLEMETLDRKRIDEAIALLHRCLTTMKCLNGIPVVLWAKCSSAIDCLWLAIKLDLLHRSLARSYAGLCAVSLRLVCATRVAIANIFEGLCESRAPSIQEHGIRLKDLLVGMVVSTSAVLRLAGSEVSISKSVIASGWRLAGAIVRYGGTHPALRADLLDAVTSLFGSKNVTHDETDTNVLCCCARSILKSLVALDVDGDSTPGYPDYDLHTLVDGVLNRIQTSLWASIQNAAFENGTNHSRFQEDSILILAELVRCSIRYESLKLWFSDELKNSVEHETVGKLRRLVAAEQSELETTCTSYLVSCVALTNPTSKQQLVGLIIASSTRLNALLEAAFCSIIRTMDGSELRSVLDNLTSRDLGESGSVEKLKLFRLVLLNLDDKENLAKTVATSARFFFFESLDFMSRRDSLDDLQWIVAVDIASALVIDMSKCRDIITIREGDIALVLATIDSALMCECSRDGPGFQTVPVAVYNSCFSLVSFFLQRFSKQLYACVPCLISALHTMLRQALYGTLSEPDVIERGQKFSRLCELLIPHKDVYKKHLLGLLLEFVRALKSDMDLVRKKSVTPAVYCLLDMLQEHEFGQLNAMMDTTGRALFSSVHKSYQKQHVYKGN